MNLRMRKSVAAVAVIVGAGLTLAACGGDDGGSSGDSSAVGEDAGVELTQENFFEETAKAQQEAGTATITSSAGAEGQGFAADGQISLGETVAETAIAMTLDLGGQEAELRLVDNVLYVNVGPMTQNKFSTLDLSDEDDPAVQQLGSLKDSFDPSVLLDALGEAVTSFEQKGDAVEIDGVQATPYEIVVDGGKFLEAAGRAGQAAGTDVGEMTYTMFVGPDNLLRRTEVDVNGTGTQIDYSGWGEDVSIEKPADSEISEQSLSEMGGAAGGAS